MAKGTNENPSRYTLGRLADYISCKKCSKKIDWGQINGETGDTDDITVYDATGLCLDCYDDQEAEKEIKAENS